MCCGQCVFLCCAPFRGSTLLAIFYPPGSLRSFAVRRNYVCHAPVGGYNLSPGLSSFIRRTAQLRLLRPHSGATMCCTASGPGACAPDDGAAAHPGYVCNGPIGPDENTEPSRQHFLLFYHEKIQEISAFCRFFICTTKGTKSTKDGRRTTVVGCWLLVVVCRLLVAGCWLLV